jgi:formylmethanofuran dehydrogenase subunit B
MICPICHTRWEAVRDESDPYEIAWTGTCKCGTARSVRMGKLIERHTEMVLEKNGGDNAKIHTNRR